MRLCIVTHKVVKGDGQGKVNYEITKEAIKHGYQVTLIASEIAQELEENSLITWVNIPVKHLPTTIIKNLFFSQKAAQWLKKHSKEFDIIKINGAITDFPSNVNAVHFVHNSWLNSPVHTWQQKKDLYGLYRSYPFFKC